MVVVALGLAIRLFFAFNHAGFWGVDGGAYLLSEHYWLTGEQIQDFTRPPLSPGFLLVPFTWAFGNDWGIKTFALFAWLPVLVPFWMLARLGLSRWQTIVALTGVTFGWMLAEMFTAGVLPMLGFCGLFFALWGIWKLAHEFKWQYAAALALGIASIAYVNQTTVGVAAYVLPIFTLGTLLSTGGPRRPRLRRMVLPAIVGVLLALPAASFYLQIAPGSGLLRYPGPLITRYTFNNASWYAASMFLPVAIMCIWKGRGFIRASGILFLVAIPISCLYSFDESLLNIFYRTRYLQTFFFYIGLVWVGAYFVRRYPEWKPYVKPGLAVAFTILLVGHIHMLHVETKLGRMVTPETAEAIEWLKEQENVEGIASNSYSLSLYIAALTGQPSPWTQVYDPPRAYEEQHRQAICLFGWREGCDVQAAIEDLNVSHVLVERLWPVFNGDIGERVPGLGTVYNATAALGPWGHQEDLGFIWEAPANPWDLTDSMPWLEPVWEKSTTKVWRVKYDPA